MDSRIFERSPLEQPSSNRDGFINFCDSVRNTVRLTKKNIKEALPFTHGLIGFCSYNMGEDLTLKKNSNKQKTNNADDFPESFVGFYTWSYTYNHQSKKGFITFSPFCQQALRQKILNCIDSTKESPPKLSTNKAYKSLVDLNWAKSQSFADYAKAFECIRHYINYGDCYQVNLTQRFESQSDEDAADLYFSTRESIKTPYSCFFSFSAKHHLLSFSPEQFIAVKNRVIESRPIKGTISNDGSDANKQFLRNSVKNKAENLMIVDLLRNDLGKVCKSGSVYVPELFTLATYKTVHHLVSHIKGHLKDGISEIDAFLSCFPGGSITGAPKIRSMEIIKELEQHSRGAYCGSVFYLNHDGNFDSNILIRTVVKNNDKLYCWAGGGIVADSELNEEYQESLTKVSNITGIDN